MTFFDNASDDDAPLIFRQSWLNLTKRTYKWIALPLALLVFFIGQGWDALRVEQGYAETSGTVTPYTCGRAGSVEYTYTAAADVRYGQSPNMGCHQYNPGSKVLRGDMLAILLAEFVLLPFATFLATCKKWFD